MEVRAFRKEGVLHREDGPARVYYKEDGSIDVIDFWVEGKQLSFWEFYDRFNSEKQKEILKTFLPPI
jgi:hypothetical protein